MANGDSTDPHEQRFAEIEQRLAKQEDVSGKLLEALYETNHTAAKRIARLLGRELSNAAGQHQRKQHNG